MKIYGVTVGTTLPKPDLRQDDPTKGNYVYGREAIMKGNSGASAYEIAVQNGFEGDEKTWLASLKGEDAYSPVKGVDYYTEAEKAEMVADATEGALEKAAERALDATAEEYRALIARVDNFATLREGSTTGDAELQDIRIDHNGPAYSTAGSAVRAQTGEAISRVNYLESCFSAVTRLVTKLLEEAVYKNDVSEEVQALLNLVEALDNIIIKNDIMTIISVESEIVVEDQIMTIY